jgi:hypothetical protein
MNRKCSFAIVLLALSMSIFAQKDTVLYAKNNFHLEAFGTGGYGSINYERFVFLEDLPRIGLRIGLSTYRITDFTNEFNPDIIVPIGIIYLIGLVHYLEVGLGETISALVHADEDSWKPKRYIDFHTTASFGYRYQKSTKGIVLRGFYSPILESNQYFRHWGGLSIGYAF